MSQATEHLVVRQHERIACRLPAELAIAAGSPTAIGLSRTVGNGTGIIAATLVDCSAGGVGVESSVYLPRQSRLHVRIPANDGSGATIEVEGTVQRASMISREPRYYLGLSFRGKNPPSAGTLERLLKLAGSSRVGEENSEQRGPAA